MRSVKTDNPDVDESAKHIKEAQGLPGNFVPRNDGTILPGSDSRALTRTRDAALRASNRTTSKEQCIAKYGQVTGQCTFTGDSNETPSGCDCDEYPFAATHQGAASGRFSVRRIDPSDNRRAGAFLGDFSARSACSTATSSTSTSSRAVLRPRRSGADSPRCT